MDVRTEGGAIVVESHSEADTDRVGRAIAHVAFPSRVIGLIGDLGAGKTRLARAIAEALGVDPVAVSSPTYVLIQEYEGDVPVYHFDTYRLGDAGEFDALGADEYLRGGGVCLIEWAGLVLDRLPDDAWVVWIEANGPGSRLIRIRAAEIAPLAAALGDA